jgi:autotransporter strand-loop-strand O-heptosyltransferase
MKSCYVEMISKSLGDTIGAVPYVDLYQQQSGNKVYFQINKDFIPLFEPVYPNIKFFSKEQHLQNFQEKKNITYKFDVPLQRGFCQDLDLEYVELRPRVFIPETPRPLEQKYVTFAIQSTCQAKYWNYKDGWKVLCEYFRKERISPVCIDKYFSFGIKGHFNEIPKKAVNRTDMPLLDMVSYINHSEFFVGTSSGLAWLAWAVGKPVVMISGVTEEWNEFSCIRIHNDEVCNGCFNYPDKYKFETTNWMWCPERKNFICTRSITPKTVWSKIKENNLL